MTRRGLASRRRGSTHARRPGLPLRKRIARALPAPGRIAAVLATAVLAGVLLGLINGPWLRVARVAWAGEHYTSGDQLHHSLAALDGTALLMVDASGLAQQLERLPAVAEARVQAVLPDAVKVTIVEKVAAYVWQTSAVRLVGVADGTLIGQLALGADLPANLAAVPLIDDRRALSGNLIVGDRIDDATLAAALRLSTVAPDALGSNSPGLEVRLTDDAGFLLVSPGPAWQADFGFYPAQDVGELGTLDERVIAQVAAVRTLFSTHGESGVSWVDARDPGRVYWRP